MYARHLPKGLDFARGSILSPTRSLNTMALIPKHSITVWGKSKPAGEASSGLSIRVRKRTFSCLKSYKIRTTVKNSNLQCDESPNLGLTINPWFRPF